MSLPCRAVWSSPGPVRPPRGGSAGRTRRAHGRGCEYHESPFAGRRPARVCRQPACLSPSVEHVTDAIFPPSRPRATPRVSRRAGRRIQPGRICATVCCRSRHAGRDPGCADEHPPDLPALGPRLVRCRGLDPRGVGAEGGQRASRGVVRRSLPRRLRGRRAGDRAGVRGGRSRAGRRSRARGRRGVRRGDAVDAAGRVARSRPDAARSVGGTNFGRSNYVATMHDASWNNNVFTSKAH